MNSYRYSTLVTTIAISVLTMLTAVSCGGQASTVQQHAAGNADLSTGVVG